MRCKARGQGLLGATATILVSLALTTLLDQASAAPQQSVNNGLARRAYEAPGLGVELEINKIILDIKGKTLTPEELEKMKGAEMTPVGFTGAPKTDWQLTAETGLGDAKIYPEAIVNGIKNKLGGKKTKGIGEEIHTYFKSWAPCRTGENCKAKIHGFTEEWSVQWPKDAALEPNRLLFSPQVTTAMPLGGLLEILKDAKKNAPSPATKSINPLSGRAMVNAIIIVTKEDFAEFKLIKAADITDDFLGFFSLLTSYCVAAKTSVPKEGPKSAFSVMPRTDFVTQYTQFVKHKLEAELASKSLTEIVEKLSKKGEELAGYKFKWKPVKKLVKTPTAAEAWVGQKEDLDAGTLEVGKFLNYLQGFDKKGNKQLTPLDLVKIMDSALRHGQVGSLGNKMELILGTQNPAPIFEFRDLDPVTGAELATALGSYEDKAGEYHAKAHTAHKREEPSAIEN